MRVINDSGNAGWQTCTCQTEAFNLTFTKTIEQILSKMMEGFRWFRLWCGMLSRNYLIRHCSEHGYSSRRVSRRKREIQIGKMASAFCFKARPFNDYGTRHCNVQPTRPNVGIVAANFRSPTMWNHFKYWRQKTSNDKTLCAWTFP